jgi:plasmid stabilization system protein ParE
MRVRLSRLARSDFDDIVDYLSRMAEPGVAPRYARNIRAAINRLVDFPYIGSPRPRFGRNIRVSGVPPYLIIYDPDSYEEILHVIRILHGSRNVTEELIARARE